MKILSLETSTKTFSLAVSHDAKILAYRNIKLKRVLSSSIIPAIHSILKKSKVTLEELDGFAVGLGPGSFTSLRVGLSTVKALAMATAKPVVGISSLDVLAQNVPVNVSQDICVLCDAKRNLVYACFYKSGADGLIRVSDYFLIGIDDLLKKSKANMSGLSRLSVAANIESSPAFHPYTDCKSKGILSVSRPPFSMTTGSIICAEVNREGGTDSRKEDRQSRKAFMLFVGDGIALYKEKITADMESSQEVCFLPEKFWFPQAKHLARLAYPKFLRKEFDDPQKINPIYLYPADCQVNR